MKIIKNVGKEIEIEFSIQELLILNNCFNEICHGIEIKNFLTKFHVSKTDAGIILNQIGKILDNTKSSNLTNEINETYLKTNLAIRKKNILQCQGCEIVFFLSSIYNPNNYIENAKNNVIVIILIKNIYNHEPQFNLKSKPQIIPILDLQNLLDYFKKCLDFLENKLDIESITFINSNKLFKIETLSRKNDSAELNNLMIRFMLNLKEDKNKFEHSYIGGEFIITVENIYNFLFSIESFLSDLGWRS